MVRWVELESLLESFSVQAAQTGRSVTTVEGLSPDLSHPVQRAWLELQAPQCGYCHSGQMMTAAALIGKIAKPTDADIDNALSGNICRCGTYQRVREAVHKAAALVNGQKPAQKTAQEGGNR